jgi:TolA-binding protein
MAKQLQFQKESNHKNPRAYRIFQFGTLKLLSLALLLFATISFYAIWQQNKNKETNAENLIWSLEHQLRSTKQNITEEQQAELLNIINKYPKTKAGQRAILYIAALHHIPNKNFKEAITLLKRIQIKELKAKVTLLIGDAYFELGDYQQATQHYQKALSIETNIHFTSEALLKLAQLHLSFGNTAEAVASYQRIVKECPGTASHPKALKEAARLSLLINKKETSRE